MWKIFHFMKKPIAGIIGLFLVLGRLQYPVYEFRHAGPVYRCPAAVIRAVSCIHFFVVEMLRLHVVIFCNIPGKLLVGSLVFTDKTVVAVADTNLSGCRL